jgi:hypothetical protein
MASFDFNRTAVRLSRNPLGIIALFIVLVYGMAALVLAQAQFASAERLPLVWFLVAFPPFVLAAFVYLVACHHTKLYAPADFRNDDNFLSALSPEARRRKLELEQEELPAPKGGEKPQPGLAEHDSSRMQYLAPRALSGPARLFVAEELVLRKLESEWQVAVQRDVRVGDVPVDGVAFLRGGGVVAIEVKAPRDETQAEGLVTRVAGVSGAALAALQHGRSDTKFLVAVVLPKAKEPAAIEARLNLVLRNSGFSRQVECRVFSMETLADEFGLAVPMTLLA